MIYDVLVVSPHMDDAVLSLGEHMLKWKNEGKKILVVTVFTKFNNICIPKYSFDYIKKSGFKKVIDFERARVEEDKMAMKMMGLDYIHWDFKDAGFRGVYKTRKELLSGKIIDVNMVEKIRKRIILIKAKEVYLPYGVGGNVDHFIVKEAGNNIKNNFYYLESPYLWQRLNFLRYIFLMKKIRLPTFRKEKILREYKSQYKLLKQKVWWPLSEVILKG